LDLFVGEQGLDNIGNINFYRNTGTATNPNFTFETENFASIIVGGGFSSPTFADIDNDGDFDLFVGENDGGLHFYRNVTPPPFTDISASLAGVDSSSVAWGDYDDDGDLDILLTGWTGSNQISKVYRNNNESFDDISASLLGVFYSAIDWGDYDRDGDLDILLTGNIGSSFVSKVYRNDTANFVDTFASLSAVGAVGAEFGVVILLL